MLTIRLQFLNGRYYTHLECERTGRILNADWPPNPWCLIRELSDAWGARHPGEPASSDLLDLLESLGRETPMLVLPAFTQTEAVERRPLPGLIAGEVPRMQKFASFEGELCFQWMLLSVASERRRAEAARFLPLLQTLVEDVRKLGLPESQCTASVTLG